MPVIPTPRRALRDAATALATAVATPLVAAALVATPLVAAPLAMAPVAAAAPPCPDVQIVFARGTSEAPGIGRVGEALRAQLQGLLPEMSIGTYGVVYPATYDFPAAADGARDATAHIASMAVSCPGTRMVLGGYSQGAAVVDMLVGIPPLGDRVGGIGSAAPLPAELSGRVAAMAVFGNPSAKFGIPVNAAPAPYVGRGIDLCNDGDPICSDGRNPFAHTNYEKGAATGQAAAFVATRVAR